MRTSASSSWPCSASVAVGERPPAGSAVRRAPSAARPPPTRNSPANWPTPKRWPRSRRLKLIGRAAQNERYWRAAAWFVERKNPDEFGLRSPGRYTESQLRETLLQVVTLISIEVPPEKYERIMQRIDALIAELLAPRSAAGGLLYRGPSARRRSLAGRRRQRLASGIRREPLSRAVRPDVVVCLTRWGLPEYFDGTPRTFRQQRFYQTPSSRL